MATMENFNDISSKNEELKMLEVLQNAKRINFLKRFSKNKNVPIEDCLEDLILPKGNLNQQIIFNENYLCIDGVSCVGKSSNFKDYKSGTKINQVYCMSSYNISPLHACIYYFEYLNIIQNNKGCIYDRSPISNIAWNIIWSILSLSTIKNVNQIEEFINDALDFAHFEPDSIAVIIIIDSNIDALIERTNARIDKSSPLKKNSAIKSTDYKTFYIVQNLVYYYFAKRFNYPLYDVAAWPDMDSIYENIKEKYAKNIQKIEYDFTTIPQIETNLPKNEKIKILNKNIFIEFHNNAIISHSR